MPLDPDKIAALDNYFAAQQPAAGGLTPEKIALLDAHFGKQLSTAPLPEQDSTVVQPDEGFWHYQMRNAIPPMAKSFATGVEQSPMYLGDTANALTQGITRTTGAAKEGLASIGVGEHLTPEQAEKLTNPTLPFMGSNEVLNKVGLPVYEAKNPYEMAANVLGNVAGTGAIAAKGPAVLSNIVDTAKDIPAMISDLGNPPSPQGGTVLPTDLQNLSGLPEAVKGTRFARQPNAINVGLDANKAISESYGADQAAMNDISQKLKASGNQFNVQLPEIYDKLDKTINTLSKRVAPGSQEDAALGKLMDIRDNLIEKNGVPQTSEYFTTGNEPVAASRVSPNDLVEIRKSINSGLDTNKFLTAGKGQLLDLKKSVQDGLKIAADQSPEFGAHLDAFDSQAAQLGKYQTDAMRKLWQPEDYVAHTSGQNLTADGLGRSSTFLDNLNRKNAGTLDALTSVLPPDKSAAIIKNAQIVARGKLPSLKGAAAKIISGHPLQAAAEAGSALYPRSTNIEAVAKNIKNARGYKDGGPVKPSLASQFLARKYA